VNAFRIAKEEGMAEQAHLKVLRDKLWNGLSSLEQVFLNGDAEQRIAGNINISFNFVEGESLIMALKRFSSVIRFSLYFRQFRAFVCVARFRFNR
jgi:cysteine sulfinate desulfinase/cysteine desulfurase-like protein